MSYNCISSHNCPPTNVNSGHNYGREPDPHIIFNDGWMQFRSTGKYHRRTRLVKPVVCTDYCNLRPEHNIFSNPNLGANPASIGNKSIFSGNEIITHEAPGRNIACRMNTLKTVTKYMISIA